MIGQSVNGNGACDYSEFGANAYTKYQIIDKLEDQVDELNDLEAEHSVRLAQLEKGIEPYVLKNESLQESLKNKENEIRQLHDQIEEIIQRNYFEKYAISDKHECINLKLRNQRQFFKSATDGNSGDFDKNNNKVIIDNMLLKQLIKLRDNNVGTMSELLLSELNNEDLSILCTYMDVIDLEKDDIICEKGKKATFFCFILEGMIKTKKEENKGKWKAIKKSIGTIVGYEQAFEGGLRPIYVSVESDKCKVLAMPFRILDKIPIFNPLLAMKMKGGFASCIIHNIRKERPKWLPKPVDPPPATTPIHVKEHAKEHEKEHEKISKKNGIGRKKDKHHLSTKKHHKGSSKKQHHSKKLHHHNNKTHKISGSSPSKKIKKKSTGKIKKYIFRSAQRYVDFEYDPIHTDDDISSDILYNEIEELLYQENQKEIEQVLLETEKAVKKEWNKHVQERDNLKYDLLRDLRRSWKK